MLRLSFLLRWCSVVRKYFCESGRRSSLYFFEEYRTFGVNYLQVRLFVGSEKWLCAKETPAYITSNIYVLTPDFS